ncbi:MAG: phospho-sugar mutase [Spirochaetia bacterium]|nr:phospho-sugar mutase [Spirochaetia bacterium]
MKHSQDSTSDHLSEKERAVRKRILDWVSPAFPLEIREEAVRIYMDYIESRLNDEIDFYKGELEFGTGGLRGVLGYGSGRMNLWTVGRVSLAFSRYLKESFKKPALVIAHDSRRMSREFATTAAGIGAVNGIKVHLFKTVAPTPMLSYAVRKLKASGGIVITASHNPPEYNGFKAYLNDGSQLVGSVQKEIEKKINEINEWGQIPFLKETDPLYKKYVSLIGNEIKKSYYSELKKTIFVSPASNPAKKNLKIVYSPLHGTGGPWMSDMLSHFGFKSIPVKEQTEPDGEFPTVKYPNPEEAEAMRLAEETAVNADADIFLATDPDADRMGAGVKTEEGKYVLLNGNQIGSIMCAYLAEKAVSSKSKDQKLRYHLIKTIVTTELQRKIADKNKIKIHDVLTGFKYIAEQMSLMESGKKGYQKNKDVFLFGGEESYGYLPVSFVRDKDSLSSTLLLCEILAEKGDLLSY